MRQNFNTLETFIHLLMYIYCMPSISLLVLAYIKTQWITDNLILNLLVSQSHHPICLARLTHQTLCFDVHLKVRRATVIIAAHEDSCSAFSGEDSADASKVGESEGVSSTTGGLGWTENAAAAGWNLAT